MKHVLISGGSGFLGSHLCDYFLKQGYAVTAVDNLCTGRKSNLESALQSKHFQFLHQDICEPLHEESLFNLERHGLAGVLHFACPASPVDFDRIPFEILAVDSLGTMRTVELAARYKARYLLASTSEIYGDPLVHPQKEDYWGNVNTLGPRACYDETKRFAEAYVSTAIRGAPGHAPLNAGIVRIFNTYGPRMRLDDGRIVPELCRQALQGKPLTVHGNGRQTRSFCYVDDLIAGIFKLFTSNLQVPCNIGNPREFTVLEFAEEVMSLCGGKTPLHHLPGREDDPKRRCPDITRAINELKWKPEIPLAEGLKRTIDHFKAELKA
jgi:dTDP-glucose 4,6-dehydratase